LSGHIAAKQLAKIQHRFVLHVIVLLCFAMLVRKLLSLCLFLHVTDYCNRISPCSLYRLSDQERSFDLGVREIADILDFKSDTLIQRHAPCGTGDEDRQIVRVRTVNSVLEESFPDPTTLPCRIDHQNGKTYSRLGQRLI
jgi:hypothetical protein